MLNPATNRKRFVLPEVFELALTTSEEQEFGRRMARLMDQGIDFRTMAKATLQNTLGESAAPVMIKWIGTDAMAEPTLFARALALYFGDGAASVLGAVESLASEFMDNRGSGGPLPALDAVEDGPDPPRTSAFDQAPVSSGPTWRRLERFDANPSTSNVREAMILPTRGEGKIDLEVGKGFGLDMGVWHEMKRSLYSNEEGRDLLCRIWRHYGEALGEKSWRMLGTSKDISLSSLEDLSRDLGWGELIVSGEMDHGTSLNVSVKNCSFCELGSRADHFPSGCEFAGLCEGFAKSLYGGNRTIKGIRGPDGGDGVCKFEIRRP